MLPSAEARRASTALLAVGGVGSPSYALPSSAVVSVEHCRDYRGEEPLDALALLGLGQTEVGDESTRVALLDDAGRRVALLVRGALSVVHAAPEDLLELPTAMQARSPLISHVAVLNGKPSLFVLSPARLAQALRAHPDPVLPASR